jgi:GNAT superfamily N-acetyltransferase
VKKARNSMKKYSVRPAAMSDLNAVFDLVARQRTIDFGSAMLSLDDLQKRWETCDLATDTLTAFAEGELAGYAELRDGDSPFIYLAARNNVDLGFQLLKYLEQKAAIKAGGKVQLFTQISEKNQPLLQLFASNGYTSNLSFLIMELALNDPPAEPQWAEGIRVRSFYRGFDEQVTYRVDEEASKDKGYHNPLSYEAWVKRMGMNRDTFDAGIWFLACAGSDVVGLALNTYDTEPGVVWVDHLSVLREWRNKGIGKALLLHSFGEFHRRGLKTVKLSVDSRSLTNAPRLYESVGMQVVQQYHIYKKDLQM